MKRQRVASARGAAVAWIRWRCGCDDGELLGVIFDDEGVTLLWGDALRCL